MITSVISRPSVLGGTYGPPIVFANVIHSFIPTGMIWLLVVPAITLALAYGALLFREPFDPRR